MATAEIENTIKIVLRTRPTQNFASNNIKTYCIELPIR